MSTIDILKAFNDAGIQLYVAGGKLRANVSGDKIPLRLKRIVSRHKDEMIAYLERGQELNPVDDPGSKDSWERIPLSFAQQRLWFEDQISQAGAHYNIQVLELLKGEFREAVFENALRQLIQRHEILRTHYRDHYGDPYQVVTDRFSLPYEFIDLSELTGVDRDLASKREIKQEKDKPFNLQSDLALRIKLLRLTEDETLCVLTIHHIACDGWSVGILLKELNTLYEAGKKGIDSALPSLALQYKDYAVWQRSWLTGSVKDAQLSYWKQQLADIPDVHELPLDYVRPAQQSYKGSCIKCVYRKEMVQTIKGLCLQHQVTVFIFLYTVFAVFLSRFSGAKDIVVGSPIAGRIRKELESLVGCFVNSLVLRTIVDRHAPFIEQLKKNRNTVFDAYDNQYIPFEMLVETLYPVRDMRHSLLFQVVFELRNEDGAKAALPRFEEPESGATDRDWRFIADIPIKTDLELHVTESRGELSFGWLYNSALFDVETIETMIKSFDRLMDSVTTSLSDEQGSKMPVKHLEILSSDEIRQLVQREQSIAHTAGRFTYFHELVEAQAQQNADAIAVVIDDSCLSYHELNRRSNQLAHCLMAMGVGPDALVGICLLRSLDMIVAMLAVLKAGGGYLPLDPRIPSTRLEYIVTSSHCKFVLSDSLLPEADSIVNGAKIYSIDDPVFERILSGQPESNITIDQSKLFPENLAYSIFTSGSTGLPKGVLVTHRGLQNLSIAQAPIFGASNANASNILQFASFGFDAATWDVVMALSQGATLHLLSEEQVESVFAITNIVRDRHITHATLPPALLSGLDRQHFDNLECLVVAGEPVTQSAAEAWSENRRFFNAYGPTETAVCVTVSEYQRGSVTIGKSILNHQCYVLDEDQNLVPTGVVGELCVGGLGLARGYSGQASLTAEKFIPSPFSSDPGERLYRTGDRVRRLHNGDLQFVGRVDGQVKIRGYRIELEEIKLHLLKEQLIDDAVVLVHEDDCGQQRLVSFVVSNNSQAEEETSMALMQNLKKKLPGFMVPDTIQLIDKLPMTSNGKLDVGRLTGLIKPSSAVYVPPRNETEKRMAVLWGQVLKREKNGVNDDFFEVGGHSLLAMKLVTLIRQTFSLELPLKAIFQSPTIGELSKLVEENGGKSASELEVVICLGKDPRLESFYCCLGLGLLPAAMRPLQYNLKAEFNFKVLQAPGLEEGDSTILHMDRLARLFADAILKDQPNGRIKLLGHSFGGCIAFEIANLLKAKNRDVQLVLLECFFNFFESTYGDVRPEGISSGILEKSGVQSLSDQLVAEDQLNAEGTARQAAVAVESSTKSSSQETVLVNQLSRMIETQFAMLKSYECKSTYDGKIQAIFSTEGICGSREMLEQVLKQYASLSQQEISYVFTDGGHTSMLREPYASKLSEVLSSIHGPGNW